MERGRWFCQYTPTHSLLLAPFVWFDLTPLLGPLEGVVILIGLFLLIRAWTNSRMAKLVSILLLLSPFFLILTSSHMAHSTNLMFVVWSLLFLTIYWKTDRFVSALASGFLLGLALTTKPYPIVVWGVSLTFVLASRGRKGWKALAGMILGALPPLAGFLLLNSYYTGNPFITSYQIARDGRLIGFGVDRAGFPVYGDTDHTLWRGIKNGIRQVASGATSLFGWPLISLLPLAASVGLMRKDRRIFWLSLPLLGMFIILLPLYWPAVIYGPRHYFTFLPLILLLSALGILLLLRTARNKWGGRGGSFVFLILAGLFGITALLYLPEEIRGRSGPWQAIESRPWTLSEEIVETPAIVFMEASDKGYPNLYSGMNYVSPLLDGPVIFCAHQRPEEDQEFMAAYAGRNCYLYFVDGSGNHYIEPWSLELAEELTPSRSLHVDQAALNRNLELLVE